MNTGCCGRPMTALGLLAEADAFPPSHPRGAVARKRIAYSVVAYRAKQTGNRAAYDRAMHGLRSLGDAAADAAAGAAASQQITQLMQSTTGGSARVSAVAAQVRTWVNLITGLASIGTGIGSAAGGDANAIRVANLIIGWVRAIGNGTLPPIPTLSANDLAGFVNYCTNIRPVIEGGLQAGFAVAAAAIQVTNRGAGDASATAALNTMQTWLIGGPAGGGGLLNGICTIPQIAAAVTAAGGACPPGQRAYPWGECAAVCPDGGLMAGGSCNGPTQTRCPDGSWIGRGYAQQACPSAVPPPPSAAPAVGLETGAGGCVTGVRGGGPGAYNMLPPAGILNTITGAAVPGTAGTKICGQCHAPSTFVPGVVDSRGFWATPPACLAPSGGGSGSGGGGGSSSGGGGSAAAPLLLVGAALAAKYFLF